MNRSASWVLIILGVLVAAFLAQRILTGDRAEGERTGFQALLAQIDREQVERVTLDVPNDRAEVTYAARAGTVDVLYPDGYEERLVERLVSAGVPLEIQGRSAIFELLIYYGPFAAFWIWLARRLPRRASARAQDSA